MKCTKKSKKVSQSDEVVDPLALTMILKKLEMEDLSELDKVTNEAKQLRKLQHRNIVAYSDDFLHEDSRTLAQSKFKFLLLMEYCPNGDLLSRIKKWQEE